MKIDISKLSTDDISKIVNNYYKKSVEDQLKIFKNQTTDSKLNTFANCYNEFSLQSYLDLNLSKSIVKNLTKLRISAHTLLIEKGRYFRPKLCRNLRLCSLCNKIEDEEHFLLFFKKHDTLRSNLFSNLNLDLSTLQNDSETTSSTFNKLMNPKSISETKFICSFIESAFSCCV